jgi:CRISPR/Cas system-associated endoribonuclease Cas2
LKTRKKKTELSYPVPDDLIDGCRDGVLWTHRALGTGLALLTLSDAEFREVMQDGGRLQMVCQVLKMLLIDSQYAEFQAEMRQAAIDRIIAALVELGHPETEFLITSPLDPTLVPDAPGISADVVNGLRPDSVQER